jgi:NTP pyrophosphatase (non-canonical NTP hydrolase)
MLTPATLEALLEFRRERDWEQFHNFRSQAISISLEAAELLEHVQWTPDNELRAAVFEPDGQVKEAVAQEVADIAMYLSLLAHDLGLDLDAAVQKKLALNRERYPVDKAHGKSTKYTKLR